MTVPGVLILDREAVLSVVFPKTTFHNEESVSSRLLTSKIPLTDFSVVHMDEFIDELLREERVCDIILPRIQVGFSVEICLSVLSLKRLLLLRPKLGTNGVHTPT